MKKFNNTTKECFINYFSKCLNLDRATRKEYWIPYLFYNSIFLLLLITFIYFKSKVLLIAVITFVLTFFIPNITLLVRRFHDVGLSGWYLCILVLISGLCGAFKNHNIFNVLSVIISIIVIIILCTKGQNKPNKWGEPRI